jgi:hypothetical protein
MSIGARGVESIPHKKQFSTTNSNEAAQGVAGHLKPKIISTGYFLQKQELESFTKRFTPKQHKSSTHSLEQISVTQDKFETTMYDYFT